MSNLYSRFKALLAQPPLQVGTVISQSAGVCVVELPGGARVRARGNYAPGASVFLRDGAIESNAPSLPVVQILL